jgi:hypothetical protein
VAEASFARTSNKIKKNHSNSKGAASASGAAAAAEASSPSSLSFPASLSRPVSDLKWSPHRPEVKATTPTVTCAVVGGWMWM